MSTRNICHRTSSSTTNQFHIHKNTNNKDICNTNNKLFMILYNCNFMMYCMRFHTGFLLGREGGWGSECTLPGPASSPSSMEDSGPVASSASSSQSLFTILFTVGSVTAYTSGPSWRASVASETLTGVTQSKIWDVYLFIWTYVCHFVL